MAEKAREKAAGKLTNGPCRFPAFWPESMDYAPDHNWEGSGMVGLQEMLLQTHPLVPASVHGDNREKTLRVNAREGEKLRLLPAWPQDWEADFKLHTPRQTVVQGKVRDGKIVSSKITPEERWQDVILLNGNEREND